MLCDLSLAVAVIQRPFNITICCTYSPPLSLSLSSSRFHVNDLDEDTLEHIQISPTEEGQYQLPGQVGGQNSKDKVAFSMFLTLAC